MGSRISKEDLLSDLRKVDQKTDGPTTQEEYHRYGKHSETTLKRRFGSFNVAKEKAGLEYNTRGGSSLGLSPSKRLAKTRQVKEIVGCFVCEYSNHYSALQFHHVDPDDKDISVSRAASAFSWELTKEEMKRCVIVCSNCHNEIHSGYTEIDG